MKRVEFTIKNNHLTYVGGGGTVRHLIDLTY